MCWVFYYVVRILKDTSKIVEEFRIRLQALSETVKSISEKVEHIYSIVSMAGGGVGEFFGRLIKRKSKKVRDDYEDSADEDEGEAKNAVDRAVDATVEKMKKMTKKIKQGK